MRRQRGKHCPVSTVWRARSYVVLQRTANQGTLLAKIPCRHHQHRATEVQVH